MRRYQPFVDKLSELLTCAQIQPRRFGAEIHAATNGLAKSQLYDLVSVESRRRHGAFFTGEAIAQRVADFVRPQLEKGGTVCDPACGAGDLLIACAEHLPLRGTYRKTLDHWSNRVIGWDIHQSFVEAARIRMAFKCLYRSESRLRVGGKTPVLFANIRLQNALSQTAQIRHVDAVVMNPPFCKWQAPKSVSWASGSINSSALFTERVFGEMSPASKLVAVLPDVLRSGARYQKWRELMLSMGRVEHVVPLDQFDASTDVHVFILVMTRTQSSADPRNTRAFFGQRATASRKGYISEKGASQIRDLFNVSVGPVVDYREPRKGNWFPFLVARDVPAWESLLTGFPKRRFRGTTVRAPFVVVRRTSRPEDRFRAVGTIIRGRDRYAVENHLITIQPKDGKLKTCQLLLDVLKRQETSDYLNQAIRCRHLTVSAVKSIPWESIVG